MKILFMAFLAVLASCQDVKRDNSDLSMNRGFVDRMDEDSNYQAQAGNSSPKIVVDLKMANELMATFATDSNSEYINPSGTNFIVGQILQFDLRKSTDDHDLASNLSYRASITYPNGILK